MSSLMVMRFHSLLQTVIKSKTWMLIGLLLDFTKQAHKNFSPPPAPSKFAYNLATNINIAKINDTKRVSPPWACHSLSFNPLIIPKQGKAFWCTEEAYKSEWCREILVCLSHKTRSSCHVSLSVTIDILKNAMVIMVLYNTSHYSCIFTGFNLWYIGGQMHIWHH